MEKECFVQKVGTYGIENRYVCPFAIQHLFSIHKEFLLDLQRMYLIQDHFPYGTAFLDFLVVSQTVQIIQQFYLTGNLVFHKFLLSQGLNFASPRILVMMPQGT